MKRKIRILAVWNKKKNMYEAESWKKRDKEDKKNHGWTDGQNEK